MNVYIPVILQVACCPCSFMLIRLGLHCCLSMQLQVYWVYKVNSLVYLNKPSSYKYAWRAEGYAILIDELKRNHSFVSRPIREILAAT